jgi:hypothetical protein
MTESTSTPACRHPHIGRFNSAASDVTWCGVCGAFNDASGTWRLPSHPLLAIARVPDDGADDLRTRVFDAIHLLDIQVAELARLRGPLTGVERARVEGVIASMNRSIAILDQTRERG